METLVNLAESYQNVTAGTALRRMFSLSSLAVPHLLCLNL